MLGGELSEVLQPSPVSGSEFVRLRVGDADHGIKNGASIAMMCADKLTRQNIQLGGMQYGQGFVTEGTPATHGFRGLGNGIGWVIVAKESLEAVV
jgi:hypothetical protein